MLSTILSDDFVWSAILPALVGGKRGSNGATMINCPMCPLYGESPDTRFRLGVTKRPNGVILHCYNCDFRTHYVTGESLPTKLRTFMQRVGISETEVLRINHKAFQYRRMLQSNEEAKSIVQMNEFYRPTFETRSLPKNSKTLGEWLDDGCDDPDFNDVLDYLLTRGDTVASAMQYYWSPETWKNINRRLIIPFWFDNRIVGWSGRLIDPHSPAKPKYWSDIPSHYLFNNHVLQSDQKIIPIVEGPLDAIAVNGIATLGAKLSTEQSRWLSSSGKSFIVVADRDKSGQRLIDYALDNNWQVSFPKLKDGRGINNWWEVEVKDCADATKQYGKLYTVRSILATATSNKIEINIKRKWLY